LEDNTEVDVEEMRYEDVDWIDLAQDKDLVNTVINLHDP
jgi:hypothetical protein